MSAKYFVYAGGRWCELDTQTGRVAGFRARARFSFVRGQRLHAARSAAVLRALRAQAAGAPSAVRDAAPLPRCPRRPQRRQERSRSRRCSGCRPSHAHCCAHSHGRCDLNANALQTVLPTSTAAAPPGKQTRASSSDQEIRIVESVHKTPVKENQVSPEKSPQKLNRHNRPASSDETKKPAQKAVTRARQSSQQHVNVVVVDRNSKWSSSSDDSEEQVARGKASLMKFPQSNHKKSSDDEEKRKRVTRARPSSHVNEAVRNRSTSSTTSVEAQKSARGKPSPIKSPQKQSKHKKSSDDEEKRKRVTRARPSSHVNRAVRNRSTSSSSSTSVEDQKSARGKPSPIKSPQKQSKQKKSSDDEEKRKRVTRARPSSHVNGAVPSRNRSTSSSSTTSVEDQKSARGKPSPIKSPQKQSKHKKSSDDEEKRKRVTRARPSSHVNGAVRNRSTSSSSSTSVEDQKSARGKPSPIKSPQKQSKHKKSSDDEEKRKRVTRARPSSHVNGAVRNRSTSSSSTTSVEAQKSARGKPSPIKSPQKQSKHKKSSDDEEKRKRVTRARPSSHVNRAVRNRSTSSSSTTSVEAQKSARGKPSPIKSQKQRRHKNSSDDEEKRKPLTRASRSSQVNGVVRDKSTSTSDEDEKSKTTGKTAKQKEKSDHQSRRRWVLEISSDQESEDQLTKPVTRSRPSRQDNVVVVDDSDDNQPVKKTKTVAVIDSDSSSEETTTKSQTNRIVSKADKLTKRLLETTDSEETGRESEIAGTGTERSEQSARCKELVIGESDVETLRRFVKQRGGRKNLARFDREERYKLRIFHRLNPLVSLQRYEPLENLLRERVTINEFARNLGLRSVAEVTPEKRYRMRRSTKNARVPSDADEKENVARPKRRRLWNNDNSLLDNVRDSISSEASKAKPEIIKPSVNKDNAGDASDSDAEFKQKVREHLAKKKRTKGSQGGVTANASAIVASTRLKENVQPNNSSSEKVAEMLKSSDDESRQTRSNKVATPAVKPQKDAAVSNKLKSAKVNDEKDDNEVRQTRSSIKAVDSSTKPKQSGNDKVTTKVTANRNGANSDREVRNTGDVGIPARTLREQNKKDASDTDSAFETSKTSPRKANLVRKGKVPSRITNLPNKKGKEGGSKRRDMDSARAKENNKTSAFVKSMTVKPVKFKKSSVANGREYTSHEDHAIVAWVCGGHQRERLVNGNRLWRELALEYRRLTGQDRSWHSLRNRYLRYVLPALGALALPPAQVSRLRAAAAAGEIKSRGGKQRRNSIFTAPVVSSASGMLRERAGKRDETQSDKEQKSKTSDKEQKKKEREQSKPQAGGTHGKGGRLIRDAPTPKKESPSVSAPRVTRSSAGSPWKGNRK